MQTITMSMMQYVSRPTLSQCCAVAKTMMEKYPFLMDDGGEGEVCVQTLLLRSMSFTPLYSMHGNGFSTTELTT